MRATTTPAFKVVHLTTVDSSLRYLLWAQLAAVRDGGGEAVGVSAPGPDAESLAHDGIRHVPLTASTRAMDPLADLRAAAQLWRILRRERPDVLHTHNPKPGLYGRVVGRLSGVPIVVNTNHGLYVTADHGRLRRTVVLGLEAIAARFSHAELIQNPEDLDLLLRRRVNRRGRTRLLGNGIDLDRFRPDALVPAERAAVRAELGAGRDDVVVGMVGRLVAEKGVLELLTAARRLDDHYVVVVIGPDDPAKPDALDRDTLRDAEAAGVRFLGLREDVDRLYGAMDLFVLPSWREGFPRAAMEAAASGLPVIATDVRGCRQVVDHEVTGLLVPVREPDPLADAIRALGEDPATRAGYGAAGARKARREFDERRVVRTVLDTYASIAEGRGLDHLARALRATIPATPAEPAPVMGTRPAPRPARRTP
jgi:glycosyltransferase involved in cell wall biosynthesis